MSAHTSPQLAHMPQAYQTTPLSSASSHHPVSFPNSAHSSFSDTKTEPSDEGETPSRDKNGSAPVDPKIKPHLCPTCRRAFTTGGHLQRHMRIHTGVKAFKCPYPGCETRTSRQDNLQQHYRTHLSPSLRRGSGSAARAAVNAAMEAAGLKSAARAPRKSKGSNGTPSSASTSHLPSPYATPSGQGPTGYPPYMYDPQSQSAYANYSMPPNVNLSQPMSANSSRVPSPVNGHSGMGAGSNHHPQQYFPPPYPSMYYGGMHPQQYRYNGAIPAPYGNGPPPHSMYPMPPDHNPYHMSIQTHQREQSYGISPSYPQMNGYQSRQQATTPLSATEDYRNNRQPSPRLAKAESSDIGRPHHMQSYGGYPQSSMAYNFNSPQSALPPRQEGHRASLSSASDGSNNDGSDNSGKPNVRN